jgi:hypothetical protein
VTAEVSTNTGRVPTVAADGSSPNGESTPGAKQDKRTRTVRRARLMVTRLDAWSVLKTSFMLSIAFAIVLVVAVAILWWILDQLGVFVALSRTVNDIAGSGSTQFDLSAVLSFGRVMGVTLVLAAVQIVLFSVLATLFAFLYNLAVAISGGLEVTLAEES